jgi:putative transposase
MPNCRGPIRFEDGGDFFRGRARPASSLITRFIADHQGHRGGPDGLRWGVESICTQLTELGARIAPSTCYGQARRAPSRRELRDEQLKEHIRGIHAANYGVYGARKVWLTLNREGIAVARCTVERLMAELGISGATRGKARRTTIADPAAALSPARVMGPLVCHEHGTGLFRLQAAC